MIGIVWGNNFFDAENVRGKKCNISYIQNSISNLSIETIIKPCTIANPFQAFNYFG